MDGIEEDGSVESAFIVFAVAVSIYFKEDDEKWQLLRGIPLRCNCEAHATDRCCGLFSCVGCSVKRNGEGVLDESNQFMQK